VQAGLFFDGSAVPRAAFEDAVLRAAGGFERLGAGEGDVVCVMLRNHPAFLEAVFGARRLGAYSCPINWHARADEAGWILRDSGARVLVASADLLRQIEGGVPPGCAVVEADPASWRAWLAAQPPYAGPARTARYSMPYTSGTTGRPKGIRRFAPTPADAEHAARITAENVGLVYGLRAGARALLPAPLYHSAPNMYAIQAVLLGATLYLESRFDAEATLARIAAEKLTHAYLTSCRRCSRACSSCPRR
jgi:long-chain acyl-CoA synthetase